MTDLWQESTRDFEAERLAHRTASVRLALADFIPYLTSAESTLDHENRVALIDDRIEAAVHQAVGSDVGAFPVVHQAAMDALHADFQAVFTERQAETQRVNAHRAWVRNQQRQATGDGSSPGHLAMPLISGDQTKCAVCKGGIVKGEGGWEHSDAETGGKTGAGLPEVGGPGQTFLPWSWGQREQDMLATRIELAKARGAENLDPSLPYDLGYLSDLDKYEIFGQTTPENISHWLYQNNPDGLKIHQIGRRKQAGISVGPDTYKGESGWSVGGTSPFGHSISIFVPTEEGARRIQQAFRDHSKIDQTDRRAYMEARNSIQQVIQEVLIGQAGAPLYGPDDFASLGSRKEATEYDRVANPTYSTCSACGGEIILFEKDPDWWMHTRDGFNIDSEKDHQPVTASRKQAGMVNLGNPSGSVAPGDDVLAGQAGAVVTRVIVHAPGNHPANAPIVDDMYAVEVQTSNGSTRWCGGTKAEIGPDLRVHWSRPDTRSASKKTAGGDYVFLTTDGRTEFGNIYNFDDSVATERGRGSLDDMKLLWREYLSSHGGSNEHHSPDQTRAVGLLADKGYYSALYLGGTGGVYIRTADRSKVAKRTPNIFVQASVGWSATTDQMGAAVGYLSREWGDHGYRIKQDDRPGVFECSHSDGSRFYISADAYGNTADVPDSTTASRKQASAPEISADTMEQAVAKAQEIGNSFGGGSQLFIFSIGGERRVVEVADPVFGPRYKDMGSYEQFYGHSASRRTALTWDGYEVPVTHVDGDNLENPIETRIVPAAQSEGMWKVEGRFSDGWKNLLPAPATKAECEEWLRSTTLFGLNSTARRRTAAGIGDINAWADGFGNWHVRVETTGVGNEQAAHDAALSRLHEELAQRNGPSFAPEVVGITLNHRDSQDGKLTFYFDETNAHEARRRTAGENPFAKKEPGAPTDAADTEGQPSETDPTASDDPAAMEAGAPVTISYTLTGEKTDAGDVEGTFDSFDGTTAFFTYEKGKFGVTNEGGKWVDSAGTVFTFAGGAPVEDPNAQQPPADGKTEVDTTKKPKPLASRHTADAWGHQPDGAYRNPSLHPETPPADLYEKAKMHWGGVGAREINPGHVFTADGFTYAFVKGQDGSWSMEGNDGGGAEFRKTDGGWEFRTFYSNDGWQKLGSRQAAVTASRHPFARSAAAGSDSIIGEKGRQADARTILQQIGTMTLMSLGQRNTVDLGDGVMFQVGAGNPLRKVIIKLNARDYYDVEIGKSQRSTFNWIVEFQQRDLEASQLSTVLRNALDQVVSASRHTAEANPFDGDSDANPYAVDERTPEPSTAGTPDDMLDGPAPVSPQTTKPRQRPSGAPANGSSNDQPMGVGQGAA